MSENQEKQIKTLKKVAIIALVIIVVLVITNIVSYSHSKSSPAGPNTKEFSMLDPDVAFTPQENFIINLQDLRKYLLDLGKQYPDTLSIYYEQLNSGANISVNKDVQLFPASLTKVVLAIIVAHKVDNKDWSWDKQFTVEAGDIDSGSGELYKTVKVGDSFSAEQLVEQIIKNSDNTANNILRRNVAIDDYLSFQAETGLEDLYNDQGLVSAKAYTRVLRVLYTSSYLEPVDSQKILEFMSSSTFHDYLSQGIPADVVFAHKYGENNEQSIFADSGIVYVSGRPYMITVLLKGADGTEASRQWAVNLMKDVSAKAYAASIK